ncbi:MAG: hypothetical protein LBQ54_16015 [Planctomycetaceae bacterium]|nr:hypothetical protein [Planctomycetaceae bacterium]
MPQGCGFLQRGTLHRRGDCRPEAITRSCYSLESTGGKTREIAANARALDPGAQAVGKIVQRKVNRT